MTNDLPQKLLRYAWALGFVALACLVWWAAVKPLIGLRAFSGFMFVAIILTGRYAGFGPSWLALTAGGFCLTYVHSLRYGIQDPDLPSVIIIYLVLGTTLAMLAHSERTARQTAETNAKLLRQEIGERAAIEQRLREEHQQLELALATGRSIEVALREAEERFRLLALHAPVGIYLADGEGRCTFVNHQWCEIAGARLEEALGLNWTTCVHSADTQRLLDGWAASVQNNEPFSLEYRYRHKNGDIRWVDGSAVILRNERGEVLGHVGTVMDVTARKGSADALRIEQELLRQSIELQERERMIIAYDIHDGIIQYTTGALMFLESYKGQRKGTADAEEIEPVVSALRQAIADGRRVMNGIRPPLLDDAGVVAAIEYLASENQMASTEIEILIDEDFGRLVPEVETALYRIAQEALFNAVKHSGSEKIQISLCRADRNIRLMVRDWGVGFDLSRVSRGVHGLSGIKERAKLLGGQSSIQSSPSEGTCVSVDLPFIERIERIVLPIA